MYFEKKKKKRQKVKPRGSLASDQDVFQTPPRWGVSDTHHQEEVLGQTYDSLEGIYISDGRNASVTLFASGWGVEDLGPSSQIVAPMIWLKKNKLEMINNGIHKIDFVTFRDQIRKQTYYCYSYLRVRATIKKIKVIVTDRKTILFNIYRLEWPYII